MTTPLVSLAAETFPNASAVHGDPHDSFEVDWDAFTVVVTQWHDDDTFQLGLYAPGDWEYGNHPLVMVDVPAADRRLVIRIADFLTDGTDDTDAGDVDHLAWATQWLTDIYDADTAAEMFAR